MVSTFLGHNEDEANYFLLFVLRAKAAVQALRTQLDKQILDQQEKHLNLSKELANADQQTPLSEPQLYSSWQYLAILSVISISDFRTPSSISKRLNIQHSRVMSILNQLISMGLIIQKANRYYPTNRRTHLPKGSSMEVQHHQNWLFRALNSVEAI